MDIYLKAFIFTEHKANFLALAGKGLTIMLLMTHLLAIWSLMSENSPACCDFISAIIMLAIMLLILFDPEVYNTLYS